MNVHVLSGDSLVEEFKKTNLDGETVVCRECLVDGELRSDGLEEFWAMRENYLSKTYPKEPNFYKEKVKDEFIKLWNLGDGNKINLWFEYELFCQVNLWFCLWLLRNTQAEFYIVYPQLKNKEDVWKGFGDLNSEELKTSFDSRVKFSHDDVFLAVQLWEAFQDRDFKKLVELADTESKCFPYLKEVCEAAAQIETRPKESLEKIIEGGKTDFGEVFGEFSETEGIYGFGDLQVKKIFDEIST